MPDFTDELPPDEPFEQLPPVAAELEPAPKRAEPVRAEEQSQVVPARRSGEVRVLPHSIEAEESLISTILIEGSDILSRCLEAGLTGRSFYKSANGIVFDHLCAIAAQKKPVAVSVLAEELISARQLEVIGGYGYLVQVSSREPTSLQGAYFVSKVRELEMLRTLIREASGAVEQAYGFGGAPGELGTLIDEVKVRMAGIGDGGSDKMKGVLDSRVYSPKRRVEKPADIYTLKGTTICTAGNLTAITSQAKGGTSGFLGAMLAAAAGNGTDGNDYLGIGGHNYGKLAVLHFDTEQSPYDWQTKTVDAVLKRAGVATLPEWFLTYNLTGLGAAECRAVVESAIKAAQKKFGGIFCVFIDGIGDLVVNPNDEAECFPLVIRLLGLAIEYKTAIVSVLHLNPTSGKEGTKSRGHLGSHLERKAETNLILEKDADGITRIWGEKQRGKPIMKSEAVAFRWSDERGMHVSCEADSDSGDSKNKGGRPKKYSFGQYAQAFPRAHEKPLPRPAIYKKVKELSTIPDSTFRDQLIEAVNDGIVARIDDKIAGYVFRMA